MKLRKLKHPLRNAAIGFAVAYLLFWAVQLTFWQFAPYKTADIVVPIGVLNANNQVTEGDKLKLEILFTKYNDVTPQVSRNIVCVDFSVHLIQPISPGVARPIGTYTAISEYAIPQSVPRNTQCYFQFTNEYKVNPIRTITKVWQSEVFIVVN